MADIPLAVIPIFAIVLLGVLARRTGFAPAAFWESADKLVFWVFFPALLVQVLATADLRGLDPGPMVLGLLTVLLGMGTALLLARPLLRLDGPAFATLHQALVRPNTYIHLSVVLALFGDPGLALASVCIAVGIPLVNMMAVGALTAFGRARAPGALALAGQMARNPIILACALGAVLNLTGVGLPWVAGPLIEILARAALPLGLLSVGAGLALVEARRGGWTLVLAVALKLVVLPLAAMLLLDALGAGPVELAVATLFCAVPVSASAYVMTRQMGGDAPLMAAVLTAQTALSALTLPVVAYLVAS